MIELFFLFSQYQCGANAPLAQFEAEVYVNNELKATLSEGQSAMVSATIDEVMVIVNPVANADCIEADVVRWLEYGQPVPTVPGLYNQTALEDLYNQYITAPYLDLVVGELGTDDESSPAFDLNDYGILYKDWNEMYGVEQIYAD